MINQWIHYAWMTYDHMVHIQCNLCPQQQLNIERKTPTLKFSYAQPLGIFIHLVSCTYIFLGNSGGLNTYKFMMAPGVCYCDQFTLPFPPYIP